MGKTFSSNTLHFHRKGTVKFKGKFREKEVEMRTQAEYEQRTFTYERKIRVITYSIL